MVVAIAGGLTCALTGWHAYQHELRGLHRAAAPGPISVQVNGGDRRVIYYEGPRGSIAFAATDISITNAEGTPTRARLYTDDARYDVPGQPGQVGRAIAWFNPPAAGSYAVTTSKASSGAVIAVGSDVRLRAVPSLIGGGIVFLTGIALGTLAIGITAARRRHEAR